MTADIAILAAATAPAGGAAIDQVIAMTVGLTVAFVTLFVLGERQRRGRRTPLGAVAGVARRATGQPVWAALPLLLAATSLLTALVGYMWDVSLHIDRGRDDGPFANPSHYLILVGLYGIVAAGYLSSALVPRGETPGRSAIRIGSDRIVPLGGALIAAAGLFALSGFPLDDVWHRLFGQDVTLWGPTHLIMLSGAFLTLIGTMILHEEAGPRRSAVAPASLAALARRAARPTAAGGLLVGLSIFQGEFDFGVPQFALALQPLMIAVSAGIALVAARLWIGPGGALGAVAVYLVIRGATSLLVGPVLGETTPALPLYVPEAILVELAALALARRPLALGAAAGLAIGTLGFAAEWPWVDAVMPIGWSGALLPEGLILAAVGGVAGGLIGALIGLALRRELARPRLASGLAIGSLAAVMACFAFALAERSPEAARADVTLTEVAPPPQREVLATVRFEPPQVADGASWVRAIAWQGGGLVGFDLDRIGEGVYRAPEPLPVHGEWKSMLRLHNGRSLVGVQVYAPADPAIPIGAVPAPPRFTRELAPDRELLQRERSDDVAPWLWVAASLTVLLGALGFLALLGWGLGRHARGPRERRPDTTPPPPLGATASGAGAG